ncbi:plasmid mobilization relaxosome protein MobC [Nocardia goodfellowii]|uniref:Bacterial mobilisation domain-containing protein n=1 Tax=Nocardia goodfellowii TaxID=882446 RepID=A0ABS4QS85_9NOCA|nr:plasmid mobilization relaxosome protein MobC [Nocardia goodfellowii]MBP2194560.1 hypothetical protein [Nocardia goodfellowii]
MVAEKAVSEQAEESAPRRSQNIARAANRRRRPNIKGRKRTLEVVLSEEEYAKVQVLAEASNCTVPWFLVQAALDPVAASSKGKDDGPWLPWPARRELIRTLYGAASSLDMLRLHHVKKIGSNLNQLVRLANIDQHIPDDVLEDLPAVLEQIEAVAEDLRERAEDLTKKAEDAARR